MIDVEFSKLDKGPSDGVDVAEIGFWLDDHLPNPPLPDQQRWSIGYSNDGRVGIRFADDKDATYFLLRWS
jgi:hypothetical protein